MSTEQLIPLIVLAVMIPLVLLRNRAPRTLQPEWLWVTPVILVTLIGFGLWGMQFAPEVDHRPFGVAGWAIIAAGLVLGGLFGFQRGRMTTIHKAADGTLKAQASPLGIILLLVLVVARQALRPWLEANAANWHVSALAIQDAFMVFVIGLIVVQRAEMFVRARRIRAGGADAHVEISA